MSAKLTTAQKHILGLIRKGTKEDGWAPVSEVVAPLFTDGTMPTELYEFEPFAQGGRARLTAQGNNILDAMAYL